MWLELLVLHIVLVNKKYKKKNCASSWLFTKIDEEVLLKKPNCASSWLFTKTDEEGFLKKPNCASSWLFTKIDKENLLKKPIYLDPRTTTVLQSGKANAVKKGVLGKEISELKLCL